MAVPYSLKNATVQFDDTDGANTFVITLEDGDLTVNIPKPADHVPDRGGPGTVIDGAHQDVTWSMSCQAQSMTADPSIVEVVGGLATSWVFTEATVSSGTYNGKTSTIQAIATAVKVFQVKVVLASPEGGGAQNLYLLNNNCDSLTFTEGMPDSFSLSCTCLGYSGANFLADID